MFNPIIPFHLSKEIWILIDLSTALFLIVSLFLLKKIYQKNEGLKEQNQQKWELINRVSNNSNDTKEFDVEIKIKGLTPQNCKNILSHILKLNTKDDIKDIEYGENENNRISTEDYLKTNDIEGLILMGYDKTDLISMGHDEDMIQHVLNDLQEAAK